MKEIINKFKSERKIEISSENGVITIQSFDIAKEDLKQNMGMLVIPSILCIAPFLNYLFSFFTSFEFSIPRFGPTLYISIQSIILFFVSRFILKMMCSERRILLAPESLSFYKRDFSQEWKEIVTIPKYRLVIEKSKTKTLSYNTQFQSYKILYSNGQNKPKELFGDKYPHEMEKVSTILDAYINNKALSIDSETISSQVE